MVDEFGAPVTSTAEVAPVEPAPAPAGEPSPGMLTPAEVAANPALATQRFAGFPRRVKGRDDQLEIEMGRLIDLGPFASNADYRAAVLAQLDPELRARIEALPTTSDGVIDLAGLPEGR